MEEYGEDWDDKPVRHTICTGYLSHYTANSQNDMLKWLMSEAKGAERSLERVAQRLLVINFVAVHSTFLASGDIPSSPTMMQSLSCTWIDAHASIVPTSCES
jgi:hypothetical protein